MSIAPNESSSISLNDILLLERGAKKPAIAAAISNIGATVDKTDNMRAPAIVTK